MIKKELTNFEFNIGESSYNASVPFSVGSLKETNGLSSATRECTARFRINLSADELSSRHHYVILHNAKAPFSVYFNDTSILDVLSDRQKVCIDLSGRLSVGENILELRFAASKDKLARSGIYGKAEYARFENAMIDGIIINQKIEGGTVNLGISVSTLGERENVRAVATLVSASGQIYYGGLTRGRGSIVIKDPLYWWPKGLGVQNLYKLTVNLYGESEIEDTLETRVGLRRITTPINQSSQRLEINGIPFLPMGAVWNPIIENDPRVYDKKLRATITSAAMAGFNALVVPLGVDEGDDLFELCDINGIVVIKELDGSLEDDYLNLVRLSRHPSLGFVDFICGRDSAASEAEKMQRLRPDLEFSMHNLAPKYPSAKASATVRTLKEHLRGGERNLFSKAATDLMGGGVIEILSDISKDYFYPASLSDFAYLSGVCAAEGVISKLSLTRLPSGSGRAVYSSLNDDSMLISGASVDFSVRRKPLHYMVERVFSPLGVFAEREDYTVGFYVSNERRLAFVGELEFRITDNKNKIIYREITDCQVAKNSSKKLFTKDLREYIEGHEREYYLEYFIKEGIAVASRGTLMFTSPKEFSYLDPHIRADVSGHDKRYSITLSSEAYAKCVELSFEDADAVFHENYFDLSQNAPYKISFTLTSGEDSALALLRSLRVRSMYDMTKDI